MCVIDMIFFDKVEIIRNRLAARRGFPASFTDVGTADAGLIVRPTSPRDADLSTTLGL